MKIHCSLSNKYVYARLPPCFQPVSHVVLWDFPSPREGETVLLPLFIRCHLAPSPSIKEQCLLSKKGYNCQSVSRSLSPLPLWLIPPRFYLSADRESSLRTAEWLIARLVLSLPKELDTINLENCLSFGPGSFVTRCQSVCLTSTKSDVVCSCSIRRILFVPVYSRNRQMSNS